MDTFRRIIPSQWLAPLNPPPFRLLDLPTELRYMVYAEVIKSQATLRKGYTRPRSIDDSSAVPDATTPCYIIDRSALSLVNRKIRGEFLHALQFTLPEEIRVDIRDAEFSPLKQFDIRARYWRKYLENGTRIKAVLHYDPNAISIAFFWGFEGAEFITRYHRLTDRIKIFLRSRRPQADLLPAHGWNFSGNSGPPETLWQNFRPLTTCSWRCRLFVYGALDVPPGFPPRIQLECSSSHTRYARRDVRAC